MTKMFLLGLLLVNLLAFSPHDGDTADWGYIRVDNKGLLSSPVNATIVSVEEESRHGKEPTLAYRSCHGAYMRVDVYWGNPATALQAFFSLRPLPGNVYKNLGRTRRRAYFCKLQIAAD